MVAPKGTPKAVVDKLNGEINRLLKDPEFRAQIIKIGIDPLGGTPERARGISARADSDLEAARRRCRTEAGMSEVRPGPNR